MFDRHEVQFVAITVPDGTLAVMQFITRAENSRTGERYEREATDEAIQAEVDKTFSSSAVSWRRISSDDLPPSRKNREAWRDDGTAIVEDPARIKPPPEPDPRDVKIAALETRLAAIEATVAVRAAK